MLCLILDEVIANLYFLNIIAAYVIGSHTPCFSRICLNFHPKDVETKRIRGNAEKICECIGAVTNAFIFS